MSRWFRWRRASALLAALLLAPVAAFAAPVAAPAPAPAPDALVLAVELDGAEQPEAVLVHRVGGALLVAAADLHRLGLAVPPGATGLVSLADVPGLRATVDAQRQLLVLTRAPDQSHLHLAPSRPADDGPISRLWGGYLNYEATATHDPAGLGAGADLEAVVFGPRGYGFAGAIARAGPGRIGVERTDIGYTLDDPARLISTTAGDFINAASSESRPVRMAGLRVGTDFALRPDLVTFPLAAVSGAAAVPTAVDVLVNGQRQAAGEVKAGQFSVSDIPVQTGVNSISVATQDALGRPVMQTITTYASRALLKPGLLAWSGEAGWVRTGYLTADDRYRAFAASGTLRAGISDVLTLEGHAEGSRQAGNLATGGSLALGPLGLLSGSAGLSRDETLGRTGAQFAASLERIARSISFSARYVRQTSGWSDLAGRYGAPTPDHSLILTLGFDLKRLGTLGANLVALGESTTRFDPRGRLLATPLVTPASTLVSGTYSLHVARRLGVVANVSTDTRRARTLFASLGVLVMLDSRSSGFAGVQRQAGATGTAARVARSAIEQGQWGYRVAASTGPIDQASAGVQYLGHAGEAEAAVQLVGHQLAEQVSARGSIGLADGHPFAGDTMTGSFAVIRTVGAPGTPVYQEHRRIGVTDASGVLVAPNLPSLERVHFSIDPADLPVDAGLDHATESVAIPRRSGALVSFDLRPSRAVLMALVDPAGAALPAGARATIGAVGYPVGIGGLVYAEPPATGGFTVELGDGTRCLATPPAATPGGQGALRVPCRPTVPTIATR